MDAAPSHFSSSRLDSEIHAETYEQRAQIRSQGQGIELRPLPCLAVLVFVLFLVLFLIVAALLSL